MIVLNQQYLPYAGIGSRETPAEILAIFASLAAWLARRGYTLRSGHADGADSAFESGCASVGGPAEIYLPWRGFNGSNSELIWNSGDNSLAFARNYHPAFDRLSQGAQKLQARNTYQVLGYNLNSPARFIVCWTPGGTASGGTGQAIRIARDRNIPVLDFGCYSTIADLRTAWSNFFTNLH